MTTATEAQSRINSSLHALEQARDTISSALIRQSSASATERAHLEDLHRRVTGALSALHGEARDY